MNWLRIKYTLKAVIKPGCWLRLGKVDLAWDKELWGFIERGEVYDYDEFVARLSDNREVWVANYPYANGNLRENFRQLGQCRRSTALFLHDHLKEARIFSILRTSPKRRYNT